jgi:hypothetical protein
MMMHNVRVRTFYHINSLLFSVVVNNTQYLHAAHFVSFFFFFNVCVSFFPDIMYVDDTNKTERQNERVYAGRTLKIQRR